MKRQAILPSFDDQLKVAIRQAQESRRFTQLHLSRSSGVMPGVITGWIKADAKTIRLESAERLAKALNLDLKVTRTLYASNDPRRSLNFDEQIHQAVDENEIGELAKTAGIPVSRLDRWYRSGGSILLLKQAFELCLILQVDLLVMKE